MGSGIFLLVERYCQFDTGHNIVFEVEVAKKTYESGNLVKTKMETVPFSQSFKDDRVTTWRFLRHSMQRSEHLTCQIVGYKDELTIALYYFNIFTSDNWL